MYRAHKLVDNTKRRVLSSLYPNDNQLSIVRFLRGLSQGSNSGASRLQTGEKLGFAGRTLRLIIDRARLVDK